MNRKLMPNRIQKNIVIKQTRSNGDSIVIKGDLICCDSFFEIRTKGIVKESLLKRVYLYSEKNELSLTAICPWCGKHITAFDSACDGYEARFPMKFPESDGMPFHCRRCDSDKFVIEYGVEYPESENLKALGIEHPENAFTWIWISLKCEKCGKQYKNFVDCETA